MTEYPSFYASPRVNYAAISTANSNRDGTGTIGTVFTAGSSGSALERIRIQATGTTTAGVVRLYLYDGTTYHLFKEVAVTAITPSATTRAFYSDISTITNTKPLLLPNGWSLRASTQNAEGFNVVAIGGDY